MIEIKSLKRITEADEHDKRYDTDVAAAKESYQKAREADHTYKYTPWFLSPRGKKTAEAHHDYHANLDAAEKRRKFGKLGGVSKEDNDETKFQAARASVAARSKIHSAAKENTTEPEHQGIIKRVTGAIADHPYLAAGAAAGIAGAAVLQKRKNRLPEPGSYNQGA